MSVEILHDAAHVLVVPDAAIDRIATGFKFTEGALWNPHDQSLLFSDIMGNQMRVWSEAGGARNFRRPSHMANGNTWDHPRRLLTCEHATSHVTRTEADGSVTVLVGHYEDRPRS